MIAWIRIALIVVVLSVMTLVLAPLQLLAARRGWRLARRLPFVWHRVACPLIGLRVHVQGAPSERRPLLLVSNHQSWADILALGWVTELSFIAKAEVRDWPAFGLLAKLQRTVFVERAERRAVARQTQAIAERLNGGEAIVLFAEGTTSDGNEVLPFKTALFGAAQAALTASGAEDMMIQPVAVAYTKANGLPLGRFGRPLVAWPGDVTLGPHLLAFLKEGAVDVEVVFGEPLRFTADSDRKRVARQAESAVARLLSTALQGRGPGTIRPAETANAGALASESERADIMISMGREMLQDEPAPHRS
ncbi:lysophospholipid acyltransferase family protein [Consotaella aegiceratis]|uniref:lysophospholipid acyltransferase family protein n=1 Tax=Consotaella aegiceratis TaxID=3097961 RepID=UPI002F3E7E89